MKLAIPLIVVVVAVLGCGRFGASRAPSANDAANSNTAPTPVTKAVDLPSLIDKSPDEVNKILGRKDKAEHGVLDAELPLGHLIIIYNGAKPGLISFTFARQSEGGLSASGFANAETLGRHVGLEIKGTPSSTSSYEDKYYDYSVSGKKCELSVGKLSDSYNSVKLNCP